MKDVIVNTHRYGGYGARKGRQQSLDDLPAKEGMRRPYGWEHKTFGDRTQPLTRMLRSNLGRPWDKVYSEICQHADSRSIRGYHIREHVWMEVATWGEYNAATRWWWKPFYIDAKGFLRERPHRRWRYKRDEQSEYLRIGNGLYKSVNDCWFEVWTEKKNQYTRDFGWINAEVECKRQLSKRELQKLGLKNGA